jgi:signal transduction histidine kinase
MVFSAAMIAALIALGDVTAVLLEDGSTVTPAPALLIAGLTLAGWPPLLLAVLAGSLLPSIVLRAPPGPALWNAGARCLTVALVAPIYYATQPYTGLPYRTPTSLLGLLLIAAVAYAVELLAGASGPERGTLPQRWRARLGALRWYVLAMVPVGALLGVLGSISFWACMLGLAPLIVAQHSFRSERNLRRTTADLAQLAAQREALALRLERLQALATTLIGKLDPQEMLELLCTRLGALMDATFGWAVLLDERGAPRLVSAQSLPTDQEAPAPLRSDAYAPLLRRGQVLLIADERCQEMAPVVECGAERWSALLSIPLRADDQPLGAIYLAFEQLRGLDSDEQRVLTAFASQAAITLHNAYLFNELRNKQAELIQSSKLAAVGTFAAGIAHEFNNLLGGMLGHAQLGYAADTPDEKDQALQVIIQACRRGRSITGGLLTFARRQEHRRILCDVTAAIDETLQLVELDLAKGHIEIVREIRDVPLTVCDLGQISQVVLNLVTNARDSMSPEGGQLTIRLRESRGMIELSVSDTGCGIPEPIRDKIFEPFMTTKGALGGSQTPGTGLGLSVSYGIVRDHGGTITAMSEVGRGTTMTVRLPIVVPAEEEEEKALVVGGY